jgi:hypothetical protein
VTACTFYGAGCHSHDVPRRAGGAGPVPRGPPAPSGPPRRRAAGGTDRAAVTGGDPGGHGRPGPGAPRPLTQEEPHPCHRETRATAMSHCGAAVVPAGAGSRGVRGLRVPLMRLVPPARGRRDGRDGCGRRDPHDRNLRHGKSLGKCPVRVFCRGTGSAARSANIPWSHKVTGFPAPQGRATAPSGCRKPRHISQRRRPVQRGPRPAAGGSSRRGTTRAARRPDDRKVECRSWARSETAAGQ